MWSGRLSFVLLIQTILLVNCTTITYSHRPLSTAVATPEQAGLGIGQTFIQVQSWGSSSKSVETRVEHAADTTKDGKTDRFWQTTTDEPFRQYLEFCEGAITVPHHCKRAVEITENGEETPFLVSGPTLLEELNLGRANINSQSSSTMYLAGTMVTVESSFADRRIIVQPAQRISTPAFGIWVLTSPVSTNTSIFGAGLPTSGDLFFCHAPATQGPRCRRVSAPYGIAKVLAVHVLTQPEQKHLHVMWFQGAKVPEGSIFIFGIPQDVIVRCEVDDEQAIPMCQAIEIKL